MVAAGPIRAAAVLLASAAVLPACTQAAGTAADCPVTVRLDGAVYVSAGFSRQPTEPLGEADRSVCEDTGPDGRGAVFPDDPEQVPVFSFAGHDVGQVVGIEQEGVYLVLLADDLTDAEHRRLRDSGLLDADQ